MKRMNKTYIFIFIGTFLFACILQGILWHNVQIIDKEVWSDQASYVATNDAREYDTNTAYGHPGGPIIEGEILLHNMFNISYAQSLTVFLALFDGLIIAICCMVCFALSKSIVVAVIDLIVLSANRLYFFATPPSAVVTPLVALIVLITLYIHVMKQKPWWIYFLWGIVSGMAIATRVDIGGIIVFTCALSLLFAIEWRKLLVVAVGTCISFALFDPFMWWMPVRHIMDMIRNIFFQYNAFPMVTHIGFSTALNISLLALLGVFLTSIFIFCKKEFRVLPNTLSIPLLVMTFGLYFVFLTAHYQAVRYFMPVILIWEVLVPFLIFNVIKKMPISIDMSSERKAMVRTAATYLIAAILICYEVMPFTLDYVRYFTS